MCTYRRRYGMGGTVGMMIRVRSIGIDLLSDEYTCTTEVETMSLVSGIWKGEIRHIPQDIQDVYVQEPD